MESFIFFIFFKFYFIFKLYIIVLVLPNIKMIFENISNTSFVPESEGILLCSVYVAMAPRSILSAEKIIPLIG